MLTKEKSNKTKLVKYITIIPIVLVMLVFVSFTDALEAQNITGTTVMEDVLKITKETVGIQSKSTEFPTMDQKTDFKNKIKEYYLSNKSKIKNADLNKYAKYNAVREEVGFPIKDLVCFMSTELSILGLFDAIKHDMESVPLLIRNKYNYNRLHELNFSLPNENLYKEAYGKAIRGNMQEVINSVTYDVNGELIVPFKNLDKAPIYPGCDENATSEELKECFSRGISIHINENFNTSIAKTHNLIGRQKIFIGFKIDENGQLKEVSVRAPHEALVTEAKRVIHTLPVLKPGIHKGKAVTVAYSIPVILMYNK